jgi:L-rhamnose mutarotase
LTLLLRDDPEKIARYKEEHANAWPEVLAKLREVGVTEMKIFLLGTRMFMYCETLDGFDPVVDFARANEDPTYQKWDELMRSLQQRAPEAKGDEWWALMECVFDLSWGNGARPVPMRRG